MRMAALKREAERYYEAIEHMLCISCRRWPRRVAQEALLE